LAVLRKRRPDLVLMDYALPDIDGVEATRRLKGVAQFAEIPVVMITGNSEKAVVVNSLKAGAVDFIVKPLDKDRLLAKIRGLLH
jgi:DNA-binding response OmpR family regulator